MTKKLSVALHTWVSIHHIFFVAPGVCVGVGVGVSVGVYVCGCVCMGKRAKNGSKWQNILSHSYLRNCTSFWHTFVKWWYFQQFFSFFQNTDFLGFSKLINKCQKEILKCAPASLHVCNFCFNVKLFVHRGHANFNFDLCSVFTKSCF